MTDVMVRGRPTLYKGVKMRSRLEAQFAALLDSGDIKKCPTLIDTEWEYEPMCYAAPAGQYLPDFVVTDRYACHIPGDPLPCRRREHPLFVERDFYEVKPLALVNKADQMTAVFRKMAVIWESEPDSHLNVVAWDGAEWQHFGGGIANGKVWWEHFGPFLENE